MIPLHPALVHFPIAFYFLEFWLLLLWNWKNDPAYHRFALITFRLGYLSMLAAMICGLVEHGGFRGLEGPVAVHFYLALGVAGVYSLRAAYWSFARSEDARSRWLQIGGAALGNLAVAAAAYAGGRLVYL